MKGQYLDDIYYIISNNLNSHINFNILLLFINICNIYFCCVCYSISICIRNANINITLCLYKVCNPVILVYFSCNRKTETDVVYISVMLPLFTIYMKMVEPILMKVVKHTQVWPGTLLLDCLGVQKVFLTLNIWRVFLTNLRHEMCYSLVRYYLGIISDSLNVKVFLSL